MYIYIYPLWPIYLICPIYPIYCLTISYQFLLFRQSFVPQKGPHGIHITMDSTKYFKRYPTDIQDIQDDTKYPARPWAWAGPAASWHFVFILYILHISGCILIFTCIYIIIYIYIYIYMYFSGDFGKGVLHRSVDESLSKHELLVLAVQAYKEIY